jgi:hypothetical protein
LGAFLVAGDFFVMTGDVVVGLDFATGATEVVGVGVVVVAGGTVVVADGAVVVVTALAGDTGAGGVFDGAAEPHPASAPTAANATTVVARIRLGPMAIKSSGCGIQRRTRQPWAWLGHIP